MRALTQLVNPQVVLGPKDNLVESKLSNQLLGRFDQLSRSSPLLRNGLLHPTQHMLCQWHPVARLVLRGDQLQQLKSLLLQCLRFVEVRCKLGLVSFEFIVSLGFLGSALVLELGDPGLLGFCGLFQVFCFKFVFERFPAEEGCGHCVGLLVGSGGVQVPRCPSEINACPVPLMKGRLQTPQMSPVHPLLQCSLVQRILHTAQLLIAPLPVSQHLRLVSQFQIQFSLFRNQVQLPVKRRPQLYSPGLGDPLAEHTFRHMPLDQQVQTSNSLLLH